ncbi:MAG: FecCD family ABC transporter permease [Vulcanibacillus sp.]
MSNKTIFIILSALLIVLAFLSILVGRYPISLSEFFTVLYSKVFSLEHNLPDTLDTVIFNIRLPRILGAILVGAALSVAGTAYQGIFKNPLVSPDILGASAGAGFGAALAIILSMNNLGIQIMAFAFGLLAVFTTYLISSRFKKSDITLILILSGILIGTLFSSFISLLKYVADPYEKLPAITFWLMGSLSRITMDDIYFIIIPVVIGIVPLYLVKWRLNIMAFGDEEAQTLGINTKRIRFIVILTSTLLTASVVSISGIIGWVGLLVPHLARMLVGPNYKVLLPASLLIGSSYLLLVDTLARMILPVEIPLGILTSIIGAPVFIYLLAYSRRGWV